MVLPVPKPPGIAAVPPLEMGKRVSMTRWPGDEGPVGVEAPPDGAGNPDGPLLAKGGSWGAPGVVHQDGDGVGPIGAVGPYFHHLAGQAGRHHAFMEDNRGFGTGRVDGAAGEAVARLHRHRDVPGFVLIQGRDRHPRLMKSPDCAAIAFRGRSMPSKILSGSQGPGWRTAGRPSYAPVHPHEGRWCFHNLDGGLPVIDADDLAYQPVFSHQDRFHHGQTGFPEQGDDRAVDTVYGIAHAGSRLGCKPMNAPRRRDVSGNTRCRRRGHEIYGQRNVDTQIID